MRTVSVSLSKRREFVGPDLTQIANEMREDRAVRVVTAMPRHHRDTRKPGSSGKHPLELPFADVRSQYNIAPTVASSARCKAIKQFLSRHIVKKRRETSAQRSDVDARGQLPDLMMRWPPQSQRAPRTVDPTPLIDGIRSDHDIK